MAGFAGAPPPGLEARVRALPEFAQQLAPRLDALFPSAEARGTVVIHPGATDPRRRWPADRFAAVARKAADDGFRVVVVGDHTEKELAETVVEAAVGHAKADSKGASNRAPQVASLAGQLGLGELAALLAPAAPWWQMTADRATWPRHSAPPPWGMYWAGKAINAAPLGRTLHRIHLGWATHCPVCGIDITQVGWTAPRCRHDNPPWRRSPPTRSIRTSASSRPWSLPPRGR